MDEMIDLRKIIAVLKRRIILISVLVLFALAIAGGISTYLLTPVYENSTQILVNQEGEKVEDATNVNVETNQQLINTYRVIINSPMILEKVNEVLNLNMSVEEINNKVTVSSASESQVIDISVKDEKPEVAAEIVNTIAIVFQEEIRKVMNVNNVTILSKATVKENQAPVSPNLLLNLVVAAAAGLLLGIGLAFLLNHLDPSVKTQQDVKRLLDVPLLAVISPIEHSEKATEKSKIILTEKEA